MKIEYEIALNIIHEADFKSFKFLNLHI